jgi:hypothetical protein
MSDKSAENLDSSSVDVDSDITSLTEELVAAKIKLAMLRKEKRQLVDELHRQYMEGEVDPKKRFKPYFDRRKKQSKTA